jgi:putative SOS response-associated peptidase YedK
MFIRMCGRLNNPKDLSRIAARYRVKEKINFPHNPNLAPTEETPIIGKDLEGHRKLRLARFGLIPGWAKETKVSYSMINARAETIREKPAYKSAFEKRRCIIPVEGFYEWRKESEIKQPYYFSGEDGALLSLAGIWELNDKLGEEIYSFTIITTNANETMKPYHDRMPVIIKREEEDEWLNSSDVTDILKPYDNGLKIQKMNPAMNSPKFKNF